MPTKNMFFAGMEAATTGIGRALMLLEEKERQHAQMSLPLRFVRAVFLLYLEDILRSISIIHSKISSLSSSI